MIRHWSSIKFKKKPEVVRFNEDRIHQWGIDITIWYTKNYGSSLGTATLEDLRRLRRVINRAIRVLSNDSK